MSNITRIKNTKYQIVKFEIETLKKWLIRSYFAIPNPIVFSSSDDLKNSLKTFELLFRNCMMPHVCWVPDQVSWLMFNKFYS